MLVYDLELWPRLTFHLYMFVCTSLSALPCLSACLCLPICHMSACISFLLSVCLYACMSVYVCLHFPTPLSMPSLNLSVCVTVSQSYVCLTVWLLVTLSEPVPLSKVCLSKATDALSLDIYGHLSDFVSQCVSIPLSMSVSLSLCLPTMSNDHAHEGNKWTAWN